MCHLLQDKSEHPQCTLKPRNITENFRGLGEANEYNVPIWVWLYSPTLWAILWLKATEGSQRMQVQQVLSHIRISPATE